MESSNNMHICEISTANNSYTVEAPCPQGDGQNKYHPKFPRWCLMARKIHAIEQGPKSLESLSWEPVTERVGSRFIV